VNESWRAAVQQRMQAMTHLNYSQKQAVGSALLSTLTLWQVSCCSSCWLRSRGSYRHTWLIKHDIWDLYLQSALQQMDADLLVHMLLCRVPQAQAKLARCLRSLPWCAAQHSPKAQHLPTILVRNTWSTCRDAHQQVVRLTYVVVK
jgi:hypothetical protein